MATTHTLIAKKSVPTDGTSSVTFSSIPATYTDLKLVVSSRQTGSAEWFRVNMNGTTGFDLVGMYGGGSGNMSGESNTINWTGTAGGSYTTASVFASSDAYIFNYLSSTYKVISVECVNESNATTAYSAMFDYVWQNNSAITSIEVVPQSGSFVTYSTLYLYGIKNS